MTGLYQTEVPPDLLYEAWELALKDVTDEQLEIGWEKCVKEQKSDFIPTPGRFRAWCLPEPSDDFWDSLPELD